MHLDKKGMAHCDTKPGNVLINYSKSSSKLYDFTLIDFGLSVSKDSWFIDATGGTRVYMGPENYRMYQKLVINKEFLDRSPCIDAYGLVSFIDCFLF